MLKHSLRRNALDMTSASVAFEGREARRPEARRREGTESPGHESIGDHLRETLGRLGEHACMVFPAP